MGRRRRHISREVLSLCLPCWQVLGRRRNRARCLACGQRLCEKDRSGPSCPTRPSSFVRETMSHSGRRIGTDSIPPRPRFGSDYGALPWLQTADQRSGQRPDRYRTVAPRGNGRPTSEARCRTKGATCRLHAHVDWLTGCQPSGQRRLNSQQQHCPPFVGPLFATVQDQVGQSGEQQLACFDPFAKNSTCR
jgi:hypothetical protein